MSHDFSLVSPAQFETLSAALIGRDLNVRFEQFGVGPDGGIDGRYSNGPDVTILQAKHYEKSGISELKRVLGKERANIDRLAPKRYILSTSVSMTPAQKKILMEIIGPALLAPGDIYGKEDLEALLRAHPDVEEAHPELWSANAAVLSRVLNRTLDERSQRSQPPKVLTDLLPRVNAQPGPTIEPPREILFLLGARPADDQFILWLGPKLQANGYRLFSEIMTLEPGDRWRKEVYRALEHRAAKVLMPVNSAICCNISLMSSC